MNDKRVTVVGAGLAGSEAAWQLLRRGIPVRLIEMRPEKTTPAHVTGGFAELVCSNSLKAEHLTNASGLLKAEMKLFDSLILHAAEEARVPAGGALAVDRERFSQIVTEMLSGHPLCEVVHEAVTEIPDAPCIVATGPLTDGALASAIEKLPGMKSLHFFDAEAPIVTAESIDMTRALKASRYGRGEGDDYINCPMTEQEYYAFYDALASAETAEVHDFEKKLVFEGCLAVEILAGRGRMTLAVGPLKPVGLVDPHTGKQPFAVVQLRQDNAAGTLYNIVGFQTRLKWGEQKRVFGMIPGLEHAEYARYGVMHRNTYLDSPRVLGKNYALASDPLIRFAGQMTGVEGYVESAASGMTAAIGLAMRLEGREEIELPTTTVMGALVRHTITETADFQPMNANFGILDPLEERVRGKKFRYERMSERAVDAMKAAIARYNP